MLVNVALCVNHHSSEFRTFRILRISICSISEGVSLRVNATGTINSEIFIPGDLADALLLLTPYKTLPKRNNTHVENWKSWIPGAHTTQPGNRGTTFRTTLLPLARIRYWLSAMISRTSNQVNATPMFGPRVPSG